MAQSDRRICALWPWMLVPVVAVLGVPMTVVLEVEVVAMAQPLVAARFFSVDMPVIALVLAACAGLHPRLLLVEVPRIRRATHDSWTPA